MQRQGKPKVWMVIVSVGALSALTLGVHGVRSWEGDHSSPVTSSFAPGIAREKSSTTDCGQVGRIDEKVTPRLTTAVAAASPTLGYAQHDPPDKSHSSSKDAPRCE